MTIQAYFVILYAKVENVTNLLQYTYEVEGDC